MNRFYKFIIQMAIGLGYVWLAMICVADLQMNGGVWNWIKVIVLCSPVAIIWIAVIWAEDADEYDEDELVDKIAKRVKEELCD